MLLKHILERNGGHKKEKLGIKAKLVHFSALIVEMSEKNSRNDKKMKLQRLYSNLLLSSISKSCKVVWDFKCSNYVIFVKSLFLIIHEY